MNSSLNTDQMQLLLATAAGMPEPATTRVLGELAWLRHLGLLAFDGGGRYQLTPEGQAELDAQAQRLH